MPTKAFLFFPLYLSKELFHSPADQFSCGRFPGYCQGVADVAVADDEGVRIKLLPYTNFYLEVYGTK